MLRVDPHVLGRGHRHDGHGALVPKGLVRPRAHRPDELNSGEAVVGDEHRVDRAVAAELAAAGLDLGVKRGDALGHAHLERVGALPVVVVVVVVEAEEEEVFFFEGKREEE